MVHNDQVARASQGAAQMLANPWVMALIVAAAIAIPLAIDSGS